MQLTTLLASTFLAITSSTVSAETAILDVRVGKDGLLKYEPSKIFAKPGDRVAFTFFPEDHNVVQASFDKPCEPLDGGFYSGYMPVKIGRGKDAFVITINDTSPIWFYCGQSTHCQAGMVGVINPPGTTNETLNLFAAAAKQVATSSNPTTVEGGVIVAIPSGIDKTATVTVSPTASASTGASAAATGTSAIASSTGSTASSTTTTTTNSASAATSSSTSGAGVNTNNSPVTAGFAVIIAAFILGL